MDSHATLRLWDLRFRIAPHDQHACSRPAASPVHAKGRACLVIAYARTDERTLTPLIRLWDLRRHVAHYDQHASQTLAGARTRCPPVHTTGRACIYYDHSSTGQDRRALQRHCHASRISPPGYAHGQDGTTTHRHTPWIGARSLHLPTRKCLVLLPSRTPMSLDPNYLPVAG